MITDKQNKPNNTSADYDAMKPYWDQVRTIIAGTKAMRAAGEEYLPRFANESPADYKDRVNAAKFTNIFADITENLASRPFSQEVVLAEGASSQMQELAANIDGQGNSIHVFLANTFFQGINYAVDWIFIDYSANVPGNVTLAEQKAKGYRPYWVRVPAENVLAVYSEMIDGEEQFIHVRILEVTRERSGFTEVTITRVRVLERLPNEDGTWGMPTWKLWKLVKDVGGLEEWVIEQEGVMSIPLIPLVPFVCGRRKGSSWVIDPPMKNAADLQIEHYEQESGLKYARNQTAFPMLAGNGVNPQMDAKGNPVTLKVGPKSVLYAPSNGDGQHGEWKFIEPSAQSLTFLSGEVKETARELRELGRQPLTAQSGNLTVVTTAFAAQKGNSAIEAWSLLLKDAAEQALYITGLWIADTSKVEIVMDTDFDLTIGEDDGFGQLLEMRKSGDISRKTLWEEAKRRGKLSADFDADEEDEELLAEGPSDIEDEDALLPPDPDPDGL